MSEYFLGRHIHLCEAGGQIVFLDLRRDEYWAIERSSARVLAGRVKDWPVPGEPTAVQTASRYEPAETHAAESELESSMLKSGLLTRNARKGKPACVPRIEEVTQVLVPDELARRASLRCSEVLTFIESYIRTSIAWKVISLERIVQSVRERKERETKRHTPDIDMDRRLVATFTRLRPFFFTQKDQCLFDSLVLVNFLARFNSYPTWVLGVTTSPFCAHSWIQGHGLLYNGPIELWGRYTPIMAV